MAKVYSMPPDTREREKIVGGILDIRQLICVVIGFVLYGVFCLIMFRFLRIFAFVLGIPFLVIGVVFAFKKVGEYSLFQYFKFKFIFNRKIKYYINAGFHKKLEFNEDLSQQEGDNNQ